MDKLKPCPFCGSDKDLRVEVYQCDRIGWEEGWEPSITCICGIDFGIGFAGSGCDPDKIEERIVSYWNMRADKNKIDSIAHEIWSAAQLLPDEGIEDGVDRIVGILTDLVKK